jgi:hypothetical protein
MSDSVQIPYQEILQPLKTNTAGKPSRREKVSGLKLKNKNRLKRGQDQY